MTVPATHVETKEARFEKAVGWCADRLTSLQQGDPVPLTAGPLFVCHVVPLQAVDRPLDALPFASLTKAILALQSVKPGGYDLAPSRGSKYATLVCMSHQLDRSEGSYAYAYLTRFGQIELVATAPSFIEVHRQPFVIHHTAGYERTLNSHGLGALRTAIKHLALAGPALFSLSLLRLDGVQVDVSRPGAIEAPLAPAPAETITEKLEVEDINALSDAMLRGAFDQLREKLGLAQAGTGTVETRHELRSGARAGAR